MRERLEDGDGEVLAVGGAAGLVVGAGDDLGGVALEADLGSTSELLLHLIEKWVGHGSEALVSVDGSTVSAAKLSHVLMKFVCVCVCV